MTGLQTSTHPYLGIYTKCFLWQTDHFNIWIDSGLRSGWEPLLPLLSDRRHNVLLLTHGHWDHIGGVHLLREHGGTVYGHPADRPLLTDLEWHWQLLFGQFREDFSLPAARESTFRASVEAPADLDQPVAEGDMLCFDQLRFRVLETPGHSRGSVCYLEEGSKTLFTGDALMGNGFFGGTPQIEDFPRYLASMDRLESISVERVLTDHTPEHAGRELAALARAGRDCALRMEQAVRAYVAAAPSRLRVGEAAAAIARAEGKNVGGGTCVSALAALRQMTEDPRARLCTEGYI